MVKRSREEYEEKREEGGFLTSGRAKQEPQELHGELRNWRGLGFMILKRRGKSGRFGIFLSRFAA